ncbi:MAG: tryptophan-rich sensory protein [Sphingosinicella sp.]
MTGLASRSQLWMGLLRWALVTVPSAVLLASLSLRLAGSPLPLEWAAIYALLGLSLAILLHARGARRRRLALGLFLLLLAWSYSAFLLAGLPDDFHFILVAAMLALGLGLAILLWTIRRSAALLMLPFLVMLGMILATHPRSGVELEVRPGDTDIAVEPS